MKKILLLLILIILVNGTIAPTFVAAGPRPDDPFNVTVYDSN